MKLPTIADLHLKINNSIKEGCSKKVQQIIAIKKSVADKEKNEGAASSDSVAAPELPIGDIKKRKKKEKEDDDELED